MSFNYDGLLRGLRRVVSSSMSTGGAARYVGAPPSGVEIFQRLACEPIILICAQLLSLIRDR